MNGRGGSLKSTGCSEQLEEMIRLDYESQADHPVVFTMVKNKRGGMLNEHLFN